MEECKNEVNSGAEFKQIMADLISDLSNSFPEISDKLAELKITISTQMGEDMLLNYCKELYPKRFFDILYKNVDIYTDESIDTKFLPNIDFSEIWKLDISDVNRETIWKYLQLILFTVIPTMSDNSSFGEAAKLFEAINENDFKQKLEETVQQMDEFFNSKNETGEGEGGENACNSSENENEMPNAEFINEHLNGMMNGKIGKLAQEIAEETANDLNVKDAKSPDELFKKLFQNPTKLMDLIKNVGTKLDTKLKSGDIKESELVEEATNMMKEMKNMPGIDNFSKMFSKMGFDMGKNMNEGLFNSKMKQAAKDAKMRERMREKLAKKKAAEEAQQIIAPTEQLSVDSINSDNKLFSGEVKAKRSKKGGNKKNKRKGKKGK